MKINEFLWLTKISKHSHGAIVSFCISCCCADFNLDSLAMHLFKLWRIKDFRVEKLEVVSTGTWWAENASATHQILPFQNKKILHKNFYFFSRFFSGNRSWQHGYHSNIFNNFGQHFPLKSSDKNFGKTINFHGASIKKNINKKLNRLPSSDRVNETRKNDYERKCC